MYGGNETAYGSVLKAKVKILKAENNLKNVVEKAVKKGYKFPR